MSQKLIIVKYELEDEIPIDESSENLSSAYAPPELIDWVVEKGYFSEIKTKESSGAVADVSVFIINDGKIDSVFQYIETQLIRYIEDAHLHISGGVLISKELDKHFSNLHAWLEARNTLKEKKEKYNNNCNIKLVVG